MADAFLTVYIEKAKGAYEQGLQVLQTDEGWTKIQEENDVVGFTRETEGSNINTFKCEFYIDKSPQVVSRYYFENIGSLNLEFQSEDVESFEVTKEINEDLHFFYYSLHPNGPVSGREFESLGMYIQLGEESFCQVGCSIDTGLAVKEGYSRGDLVFDLLICEADSVDSNRTHVRYVSMVDPKGDIPSEIVDAAMKNRTTFFEKFKAKVT